MRTLLIVNPQATATSQARRDLLAHALSDEVDLTVTHTTGRGHAADLAAAARQDGTEFVVVHAGDGTLNEVVNGLLLAGPGPDVPMISVVPGGSTNVFARAVGIPNDPTAATEQILHALESHRPPLPVSLGIAGQRYFTFTAGLGVDGEVVRLVEQARAAGQPATHNLHIRMTLRALRTHRRDRNWLAVEADAQQPIQGCGLALISNLDPWTYLGDRPVRTNPGMGPSAGLGVFALKGLGWPTVSGAIWQLWRARTGHRPAGRGLIRLDDIGTVRLSASDGAAMQLDGDYVGQFTQVELGNVPDAIAVLV